MSDPSVVWGCDDTSEGTLFNGVGDARVNGLANQMQTDAQTDACIESLEASRRKRTRDAAALGSSSASSSATLAMPLDDSAPLSTLFDPLHYFSLADAGSGAPELKLYDAMLSPDRQLIKAGYFVAEGSLVMPRVTKFALDEVQLAHAAIESGATVGKLVLTCP